MGHGATCLCWRETNKGLVLWKITLAIGVVLLGACGDPPPANKCPTPRALIDDLLRTDGLVLSRQAMPFGGPPIDTSIPDASDAGPKDAGDGG